MSARDARREPGARTPPAWARSVLMTCRNDTATGGVQVVFRNLVRSLERSGRAVHLLYQGGRRPRLVERTNAWGHPAFYTPMPAVVGRHGLLGIVPFLASLPFSLFSLARLIRRHRVDVINCHYLTQHFLHFVIAGRLLRVPVVVSVHGADVDHYARAGRVARLVLRLVMRGAHTIVACSEAMARQTADAFPEVRAKVTHVHNGLVLEDVAGDEPARAAPARPFVLCVCRQVAKKGVDTLLRAFALIADELPEVSLVVAGDGPLLAEHQALARTLDLGARVRFLGGVPAAQVHALMAACSLVVVPSRAEPFGLVVLEAAYHGKAIVCTRVGGMPEIITDEVDGLMVDPDDPAAMAKSMAALLRNPELAAALGARAHETLMTRFRWEDRAADYIALFERVARSGQ